MTALERHLLDRMDTLVCWVESVLQADGIKDDLPGTKLELRKQCRRVRAIQDRSAAQRATALRESGAVMGQGEAELTALKADLARVSEERDRLAVAAHEFMQAEHEDSDALSAVQLLEADGEHCDPTTHSKAVHRMAQSGKRYEDALMTLAPLVERAIARARQQGATTGGAVGEGVG